MAFELFSTKGISGKGCSFKAIADVTQISDPAKIYWYCIKAHKETRKQKKGHWHHRSQENAILKTNDKISSDITYDKMCTDWDHSTADTQGHVRQANWLSDGRVTYYLTNQLRPLFSILLQPTVIELIKKSVLLQDQKVHCQHHKSWSLS